MTVLENLEMGAFQRDDRKAIREDMDRVFTLFPRLAERKSQKAGTMSGGEQQMCAIGRALMARPKLLLLDEPSMGLAPIFVEKIFETSIEINKQGTPILLVEQNALMALDVAQPRLRARDRRDRARGRREGAPRERAGPQDLPRRGLASLLERLRTLAALTSSGKYGRREQEADARRRPPARPWPSRARCRCSVVGTKPSCARGGRVAAAGDEHGAERGRARAGTPAQSANGSSGWHARPPR